MSLSAAYDEKNLLKLRCERSVGFLNLTNDALQLVADADRIALTEENYAVEGVGNDNDW